MRVKKEIAGKISKIGIRERWRILICNVTALPFQHYQNFEIAAKVYSYNDVLYNINNYIFDNITDYGILL